MNILRGWILYDYGKSDMFGVMNLAGKSSQIFGKQRQYTRGRIL